MGFQDIEKRMAKRGLSPLWLVLGIVGLVLVGLNYVINEASWEHADYGGKHWTTYWPAGAGIVCLVGSLIAKLKPRVAPRIGLAAAGLSLIGINMMLDEWSRATAESAGAHEFWVWHLPAGLGCVLLIASVTALGAAKPSE